MRLHLIELDKVRRRRLERGAWTESVERMCAATAAQPAGEPLTAAGPAAGSQPLNAT